MPRISSLAKLPLSERLAIHNALESAPDDTPLNGPTFGLVIGGPTAPINVTTIYARIRKGTLPPPDCRTSPKATAWTLGLARKTRAAMVGRADAVKLAEKSSAMGRKLSAASIKSRKRQTNQRQTA